MTMEVVSKVDCVMLMVISWKKTVELKYPQVHKINPNIIVFTNSFVIFEKKKKSFVIEKEYYVE